MPVPSSIADLSTTAASNYPQGSDSPSTLDDTQRAHGGFIALLRDTLGLTSGTLVPATARTNLGAAASGANADITSLTALASVNGGPLAGMRNLLVNGGMQVGQRGSTTISATSNVYGWVDRWIVSISGTTVSALGYQAQDSNASSYYSLQVGNVTTTGATVLGIKQRVEALNSMRVNGKTVTFSGKVRHDTGSTQTLTIGINKANASDNFTGITAIGSTTASIANNVAVPFSFTVTLGATDGVNGIEAYVAFNGLSALTNKQFFFSDFQLEIGSAASVFEQRPIGLELALCKRYLPSWAGYDYGIGVATGITSFNVVMPNGVPARPGGSSTGFVGLANCTVTNAAGSSTAVLSITPNNGSNSFLLQCTCSGGLTLGQSVYFTIAPGSNYINGYEL